MWDWLKPVTDWVGNAWDSLDFGDYDFGVWDTFEDTDFWDNTGEWASGDAADFGGLFGTSLDWGDVLGWGQDIYGAIQQGDLAEAQAASYLPLLNLYGQASTAMAPYMDPTQTAAAQAAEEERIMGMMSPYIERAAYRGRASDLSQGVGDSSIADWRDLERQKATAELISDYVVPTAAKNVATAGTNLQNLYTAQAGMLANQPTMIQQQATAQQQANPWSNIFLNI